MHVERIHKMQECLTEKAVNELEKGVENVDTSDGTGRRYDKRPCRS